MRAARWGWAIVLGGLASCGPDPVAAPSADPAPVAEPVSPTREAIVRAADRRELTDDVRSGMAAADPALRRIAVLALGRLRDPAHLPLLRRSLHDTDPATRSAASFGIGALGEDAPPSAVRVLAGALAAEADEAARVDMIRDLGRLLSDPAVEAIRPSLRAEAPAERAAACFALAERGLAGRDVPDPVRARIAALLGAREPDETRLGCAYALARLPVATDAEAAQGVVVALGIAVADPDPDVRAYAYRALGRHAGADLAALAHGTADPEWRVAVQALAALGQQAALREGGPARFAETLGAVHRATDLETPRVHVLLAGITAAAPMARATPVHDQAVALHRALGQLPAGIPPTRARGLAHCAAAALVDRGRGWPSRVEGCGLEQISPTERAVLEARILGDLEGAHPQRLARLRRLLEHESPSVKEAAVAAAAKIVDAEATALVLEALRADDPGVRAAAADALATIARRRPGPELAPPPLPVEEGIAALRAARERAGEDELETLVTWLDTVEAVDARALEASVVALASHASYAVRHEARAVLRAWEVEVRGGPPAPIPHPVEALPDPDARPRVQVETDRGAFVIELWPDVAPTTVARFLQLVGEGFYDGLSIHRVVPGFVVQTGDPRGDGYGGPDFWQRCEDNRRPYRRGTVGVALAGRDTGGSQFFVTHGAQPHLEGRYTAFGEVVEGMEVVDALLEGDRLRAVRVDGRRGRTSTSSP